MTQDVPFTFSVMRTPNGCEPSAIALPSYQTAAAAGLDLHAAVRAAVTLEAGQRGLIPTGLAFALPVGFEGQVRPRSGLALRYGVTLLNSPGTIDADYRGEVSVLLINHGDQPFTIHRGDRIAQLVIAPVVRGVAQAQLSLPPTQRGDGGYGSTGR